MTVFLNIGLDEADQPAKLDLGLLLRENLLIQGTSGSGKSRTMRRIIEQAAGKVQIIVIDPDGEYASLREHFDFLLAAATDGDVPLSPTHAGVLARRLLEIETSAIIDLSDLTVSARQACVKNFFEAVMLAPKSLWHDVLVVFDEIHIFAPEKGFGDSDALEIIGDYATRGRKRGYGMVFGTQRLAALRKTVAAEGKNVLIGRTTYADDQDAAATRVGVRRKDKQDFQDALRKLRPGNFFAQGAAISDDRVRVRVGDVITTHPEPGRSRNTPAPPTPAKIKRLVAELRDLPIEVTPEAATITELRKQVVQLREQLATRAVPPPPVPPPPPQPMLKPDELVKLRAVVDDVQACRVALESTVQQLAQHAGKIDAAARIGSSVRLSVPVQAPTKAPPRTSPPTAPTIVAAASDLPAGQRAVLTVLAQFGQTSRKKAAILGKYAPSGSTMRAILAGLRKHGFVEDHADDTLSATAAGIQALGTWTPLPTGSALREHWLSTLPACPAEFLRRLIDVHPNGLTKEGLERATDGRYAAQGSTMRAGLARLRALDLVEDRGNEIFAATELF